MAPPAVNPNPALADKYEATHAFSAYANWLVPGAIMLGRYPFVEPSRCRSRELGELQLTAILEAGVTTFVCLQVGGCRGVQGWACLLILRGITRGM